MTQDEIIRMAREVGLPHWYHNGEPVNVELLERFAALVAAHEREAWISSNCPKCKNKVKGAPNSGWVWRCPKCAFEWPVDNAALVAAHEREACADVAFDKAPSDESACEISAAIRARGKK